MEQKDLIVLVKSDNDRFTKLEGNVEKLIAKGIKFDNVYTRVIKLEENIEKLKTRVIELEKSVASIDAKNKKLYNREGDHYLLIDGLMESRNRLFGFMEEEKEIIQREDRASY